MINIHQHTSVSIRSLNIPPLDNSRRTLSKSSSCSPRPIIHKSLSTFSPFSICSLQRGKRLVGIKRNKRVEQSRTACQFFLGPVLLGGDPRVDTAYLSSFFPPASLFLRVRVHEVEARHACTPRLGSANARGTRALTWNVPCIRDRPRFRVLASWTRNNREISRRILSSLPPSACPRVERRR